MQGTQPAFFLWTWADQRVRKV